MSLVSVNTVGPYLSIHQQQSSYVGNHGPMAGMVRYNTSTQCMEAYDGCAWINISQTMNIELNYGAIDTLHWAMKKMTEEKRIQELADKHPMVADAVASLKDASERLEVALALTEKG